MTWRFTAPSTHRSASYRAPRRIHHPRARLCPRIARMIRGAIGVTDMDTPAHFAYSRCWSCGAPFVYNPHLVPSIPVNPDGSVSAGGDRKPICRNCATLANVHRQANGLPLWNVSDEAYSPAEGLP